MTEYCKICGNTSNHLFNAKVLNKYDIDYYQCQECKFIQTSEPFWLPEAYSSAIGIMDIGLLGRNASFSELVPRIVDVFSSEDDSYLDYGGGYGVFVRMMRDKGYDFYLYDKFCENLYAKFFELGDFKKSQKFKALTAFEVFEHLENPIAEIEKMWQYSDVIIFSTELQPKEKFKSVGEWWYFASFGGQHIALYHMDTLKELSGIFKCHLFSNGSTLHILSKIEFPDPFKENSPSRLKRLISKLSQRNKYPETKGRESFLMKDFDYYKSQLENL